MRLLMDPIWGHCYTYTVPYSVIVQKLATTRQTCLPLNLLFVPNFRTECSSTAAVLHANMCMCLHVFGHMQVVHHHLIVHLQTHSQSLCSVLTDEHIHDLLVKPGAPMLSRLDLRQSHNAMTASRVSQLSASLESCMTTFASRFVCMRSRKCIACRNRLCIHTCTLTR